MFTEHEHGPVPMTDMGIVPSDDNDDDGDDDDDDYDDGYPPQHIPTMTKSHHHGGEMSVMMKVGMCQCQKSTIHHDELFFGVYMYQVTHITSGSFGINFLIESATESGSDTHLF